MEKEKYVSYFFPLFYHCFLRVSSKKEYLQKTLFMEIPNILTKMNSVMNFLEMNGGKFYSSEKSYDHFLIFSKQLLINMLQ